MAAGRNYAQDTPIPTRRVRKRGGKQLQKLWDHHYEILRMVSLGFKPEIISDKTGFSKRTVNYVKSSAVAQNFLSVLQGARDADTIDLMKRVKEFAPTALTLLEDVIQGQGQGSGLDVKFRARTAEKYLNRVPEISPSSRKGVESVHYTAEDMERIKQRAKASGVINVTPQEET